MDFDFKDIIKNTDIVPMQRNYWLVRSMSGDYYQDFIKGSFIGIGYDKILLKDIKYANSLGSEAQRVLREIIEERYIGDNDDEDINSSYAASQLLKFAAEIKEDDIVIVPGKSNDKLVSIGIIKSKIFEDKLLKDSCPFTKRIAVHWIVNSDRSSLNPSLQLVFNSRHIVSNINHYAEFIDCASSDFFKKDDNTYLVLKVNQKEDVSTTDFLFVADLIHFVKGYANENKLDLNTDDIKIKVYMQSPGDITFFSSSPELIMLIGLIVIALNGGGIKIDKLGLDISTKGIIKNLSEFLDRKADRKRQKVLSNKLEALEIENPQALIDIIKELKNERETY